MNLNRRNRLAKSTAALQHRQNSNKRLDVEVRRANPPVFGGQRTRGICRRRCTISWRARGDGEGIHCTATRPPNRAPPLDGGTRRARPSATWRSAPRKSPAMELDFAASTRRRRARIPSAAPTPPNRARTIDREASRETTSSIWRSTPAEIAGDGVGWGGGEIREQRERGREHEPHRGAGPRGLVVNGNGVGAFCPDSSRGRNHSAPHDDDRTTRAMEHRVRTSECPGTK